MRQSYKCFDCAEKDAEIERLKNELETERMRLTACGVTALGYSNGEDMLPEYKSASLEDVKTMRAELDRLRRLEAQAVPEITGEMVAKALSAFKLKDYDFSFKILIKSGRSTVRVVSKDELAAELNKIRGGE